MIEILAIEALIRIAQWTVFGLPVGIYGGIALTYIFSKIIISLFYSPTDVEIDQGDLPSASVIIPEYNEDPDLFERGVESILESEYPLNEVWIVDDGSIDTRAFEIAKQYADEYDYIHAHSLDENMGKRHAQAYGFRNAEEVDVFITMDSDTVIEDGTFEELCKPFADSEVMATTGYPKVVNRDSNLLTALIDMRYWVAFNIERAAQSVFGVVSCCCGVLSAYRYDIVMDNLDDYTNQTFLGSECTFGDDRHMTTYALREGEVVYQSSATSRTDAPETISEYLTQQTRWMRSFWRESLLALTWSPQRSKVLTTMLVIDMLLPFALVTMGFGFIVFRSMMIEVSIPIIYVFVIVGISYVRNIPYGLRNPKTFLLSPVYAALYLTILLPLSFYALITVTASGWGTR